MVLEHSTCDDLQTDVDHGSATYVTVPTDTMRFTGEFLIQENGRQT